LGDVILRQYFLCKFGSRRIHVVRCSLNEPLRGTS